MNRDECDDKCYNYHYFSRTPPAPQRLPDVLEMETEEGGEERGGGGSGRREIVDTHWCVLCREDGSVEVSNAPSMHAHRELHDFTHEPPPPHTHTLTHTHSHTQLYSVPGFKLVFSVRNFSSAPTTLKDSGALPQQRFVLLHCTCTEIHVQ